MKSQPDDDPTVEEEVPEFDGTSTDQLAETCRVAAVADEAGRAAGMDPPIVDVQPVAPDAGELDAVRSLENPALALINDEVRAEPSRMPGGGYNPYEVTPIGKITRS